MKLLKISGKHANLRLKLAHQINLDPDKKYKIGIQKLMFDLPQFSIKGFEFKIHLPSKDGTYTYKYEINGKFSFVAFEKELLSKFKESQNKLLSKFGLENRKDLQDAAKKLNFSSIKFASEMNNSSTKIKIVSPYDIEIVEMGNFCELFNFKGCLNNNVFKGNTNYYSQDNPKVFNLFPVIEWHCNIVEFSYENHDEHPHLHNETELLYVSFLEKCTLPGSKYMENVKKDLFVPIREGLREIREITLTPFDSQGNKIDLSNVVVYLQLLEN